MNALLRSFGLPALASTLLVTLAPFATGCGEDKKKDVASDDAGASQGPQKPVLDRKLAAAVKAAESAQPAAASGDPGPPENGVFAAGQADKAQPAGAPPKVDLIKNGSEPRAVLTPAPADGQKETVSLTLRIQGGAIPVEYGLVLKVDKPKDDKDKKPGDGVRVLGKVAALGVPSQVPRDLGDKLGKLKGTELQYVLGPNGGASELRYTLAKDADAGLGEAVVKGLVDAMAVALPPLPKEPVGVGGYWMVTDRASSFGVEVVRYRVYTVEKLDKDLATLSVDVRQYAAKDDADLGALANGQKMQVLRFESTGKGKLEWAASGLLPGQAELSQRTGVAGNVSGGQQAVLQAEVSAKFAKEAGDKKK